MYRSSLKLVYIECTNTILYCMMYLYQLYLELVHTICIKQYELIKNLNHHILMFNESIHPTPLSLNRWLKPILTSTWWHLDKNVKWKILKANPLNGSCYSDDGRKDDLCLGRSLITTNHVFLDSGGSLRRPTLFIFTGLKSIKSRTCILT